MLRPSNPRRLRFSRHSTALLHLVSIATAILVLTGPAFAAPAIDPFDRAVERGVEAFGNGRFADAAEAFEEALALRFHPTVLWNLGRARENDGQLEAARDHYRELQAKGDAVPEELRALLPKALERVEGGIRKQAEPPPNPAPPVPPAPALELPPDSLGASNSTEAGPDLLEWSLMGGGALALLAGATVYGLAASDESALEADLARQNADGEVTGLSRAAALSRRDEISTRMTIGSLVGGLGVAVAGLGLTLALLPGDATTAVRLAPTPGGLVASGRF